MRNATLVAALTALLPATLVLAAGSAKIERSAGNSSTAASNPWSLTFAQPPWAQPAPAVAGPATCGCTGGTPEGEADCDFETDIVNGGCNVEPNLFGSITCGETICGTSGAAGGFRDTDWYELVLPLPATVDLTVAGEFDVFAGIANTAGGPPSCGSPSVDWFVTPPFCSEGSDAARPLSAGTWWVVVTPTTFDGVPCSVPYTLTLTCDLIFAHDFESGDVCPWSSTSGAVGTCLACGNSVIELGEECDDGNLSDDDGCNSSCQVDSCSGYCGTLGPPSGTCFCDEACVGKGDCCFDACTECGSCTDPNSCVDSCEGSAPGGICFCDDICAECGDCCDDACAVCGYDCPILGGPRSEASGSAPLFGECRRGAPS